jgi:hypothetical protein
MRPLRRCTSSVGRWVQEEVNSFCNECHQQQPFLFCPLRKYGPFRPQIQVSVPLWLASILKKQGRCIIVAPKWLSISSLRTVLESERTDDVFQVRVMMVIVEADFKIFARIGVAFPLRWGCNRSMQIVSWIRCSPINYFCARKTFERWGTVKCSLACEDY